MPAPKGHKPYNNGKGGRPQIWTEKKLNEMAESLEQWLKKAVEEKKSFWWHDWCWENNIQPSEISKWAKSNKSKKFSQVYGKLKEWQESIVAKGAVAGKFSANFSKFYLGVHYGWKQDPSSDSQINNIDQLLKAITGLYQHNNKEECHESSNE